MMILLGIVLGFFAFLVAYMTGNGFPADSVIEEWGGCMNIYQIPGPNETSLVILRRAEEGYHPRFYEYDQVLPEGQKYFQVVIQNGKTVLVPFPPK